MNLIGNAMWIYEKSGAQKLARKKRIDENGARSLRRIRGDHIAGGIPLGTVQSPCLYTR